MNLDLTGRHPDTIHWASLFEWKHLSGPLQRTSQPFAELAERLIGGLCDGQQLTLALQCLCWSKDAAVRQAVDDAQG